MKSIRTDPTVHAAEGDERIRTAVPDGTNRPEYERGPECNAEGHVWSYPGHGPWPYLGQPCACGSRMWGQPLARAAVARAGTEEDT